MGKDMTKKKAATKTEPDPLNDPKEPFKIDRNDTPWIIVDRLPGYRTQCLGVWDQHFGEYEVLAKGMSDEDALKLRRALMMIVNAGQMAVLEKARTIAGLQKLVGEQQEMLKNGLKRVRRKGPAGKAGKGTQGGKRPAKKASRRSKKAG